MLLACELAAEAAVAPPMAATAARLRLAMMIRGCRMVNSFGLLPEPVHPAGGLFLR
jgi:hypothetical protein